MKTVYTSIRRVKGEPIVTFIPKSVYKASKEGIEDEIEEEEEDVQEQEDVQEEPSYEYVKKKKKKEVVNTGSVIWLLVGIVVVALCIKLFGERIKEERSSYY